MKAYIEHLYKKENHVFDLGEQDKVISVEYDEAHSSFHIYILRIPYK